MTFEEIVEMEAFVRQLEELYEALPTILFVLKLALAGARRDIDPTGPASPPEPQVQAVAVAA